jgi:hypothetical protein
VIRFMDMNDADRETACRIAEKHLKGFTRRFCVVMDMRKLTNMPATQRAMYARVRDAVRDTYRLFHVATFYVTENESQRGMLTAIGWLSPMADASRIYTHSLEQAKQQAKELLAKPG